MPETKPVSQIDKFKQAARDTGADESEAAFEAKLKKIGGAKPPLESPRKG